MKTLPSINKSITSIKSILQNEKSKRVFLVTGNQSFEKSGAKDVLFPLLKEYDVFHFTDFELNPKFEDILKGVQLLHSFKPDILIAIGGGSVIDTAKLVVTFPADEYLAKNIVLNNSKITHRKIPFIAVPTTAGSGSESTHFAVLYHESIKYSIADLSLIPDYIILDPILTFSNSSYLTAVSGMDALSQSVESFWAVSSTEESRTYSEEALRIILSVFPDVVINPTPRKREYMLKGAHLAGKAINISKTTGPHALSYVLTTLYGIPHGHAVGISLPEFFEFNLSPANTNFNRKVNPKLFDSITTKILRIFGCINVLQAKEKLISILVAAGLDNQISNLGATNRQDIKTIRSSINIERLNNNPKLLTDEDLHNIIKKIW